MDAKRLKSDPYIHPCSTIYSAVRLFPYTPFHPSIISDMQHTGSSIIRWGWGHMTCTTCLVGLEAVSQLIKASFCLIPQRIPLVLFKLREWHRTVKPTSHQEVMEFSNVLIPFYLQASLLPPKQFCLSLLTRKLNIADLHKSEVISLMICYYEASLSDQQATWLIDAAIWDSV